MRLMKNFFTALGILALFSSFAFATIDTVKVAVSPFNGNLDESSTVHVSGGFIQGFRLPVISGKQHRFTIKGQFIETLDRVELEGAGVVNQTIQRSETTHGIVGGQGTVVFTVSGSSILSSGTFKVKIRYNPELNGYDSFECRVDQRGNIASVEWVGTNIPVQDNNPATETSHLLKNLQYRLRVHGSNFPSSVQLFDGLQNTFLGQNFQLQRVDGNTLELTFTVSQDKYIIANPGPSNIPVNLAFADSNVGNIGGGGWGDYVYARIANLPNAGNSTNFAQIILGTPSNAPPPPPPSSTGGGGTGTAPDLRVTFQHAFRSGNKFILTESSSFGLCPPPIPKVSTIPGLVAVVTNIGTANAGGFTVTITRNGAPVIPPVAIPALNAGSSFNIQIPRAENRVCGTVDTLNPSVCIRCGNNQLGIPIWNDLGITVNADPANAINNEVTKTNNIATIQ
jgi:hypothetical protein